ncbi:hypothetical protein [Oceanicoccus sagamiensis]|uniref:Serine active site containing 1-like protein n=1 Tax=Oceanicoccus sagamiensis TaxID=716816 RepID=A0A1X9N5L9_9GAMM|nr:hypothetical protein [Oceanicoccus sagamiensis]ARN73388.1 hypothetical protein BST96_04240 [Oceanicoccus sagamiensis]
MTEQHSSSQEKTFSIWWGMAGCVAIMAVVWIVGPYSEDVVLAPYREGFWYRWQLAEPTFWTRFTAWSGYALHQITAWGIIYYAQHIYAKGKKPKYTNGLHSFNIWALAANAFFVGLHILQTKIWYDATAQDVHEATSFGSVTFMLVFILIMENQRRGMFFGKRAPLLKEAGAFLRRYHGYYFSWAIIYTFWYHPIEITYGHLLGTFYILLLILQGSLFFTRMHINRSWTLFLEMFVVIHAIAVAIVQQGEVATARFFFGFIVVFLITQMHGLKLSVKTQWALVALCAVLMALYYPARSSVEEFYRAFQVPLMEYGLLFILLIVLWPAYKLMGFSSEKK